jgi:hypothetical protein
MMRVITFLLISMLSLACVKKDYSITTFVTTYDTKGNLLSKRLKLSYENFNSDSQLLYKEEYAGYSYNDNAGKLIGKTNYTYKDRLLISEVSEGTSAFATQSKKTIYRYKYVGKLLSEKHINEELYETYNYNSSGKKTRYNFLYNNCKGCYDSFIYSPKGLLTAEYEFLRGDLIKKDTFIYDKGNQLIERIWFDQNGEMSLLEKYLRDKNGKLIELKTRKNGIRGDQPLEKFNDPEYFWFIDKFFYNQKGELLKSEHYDHGVLTEDYDFIYN